MTNNEVWTQARDSLSLNMTNATFNKHLGNAELRSVDDNVWTIAIDNDNSLEHLQNRLLPVVTNALAGVVGSDVQVEFVVKDHDVPSVSLDPIDYPEMEMEAQAKMGGFTPVFDVVAQELGTMTALIFGVVWRHCQMKRRVCDASVETLSQLTGVSQSTVRRHLLSLCEGGFLKDLTPDIRHKPHTYLDAGRVTVEVSVKAVIK